MAELRLLTNKAERKTQSHAESIVISPDTVKSWGKPALQRRLQVNAKVRAVSDDIKRNEVVPGVITLCILRDDPAHKVWLLDGQHRMAAFLMSGIAEAFANVRTVVCDDEAHMGREYVELNGSLVSMKPDDKLKGLDADLPVLSFIREQCPFVGYDQVRRGTNNSPIVSMSAVVRAWTSSAPDVPGAGSGGSAVDRAEQLTNQDAQELCRFLRMAEKAWGRDPEYYGLWASLNITICMWLYRRLTFAQYSGRTKRVSEELFGKCLMALSADAHYVDWLRGRNRLSDRDRSPCYSRIKVIFAGRLLTETGTKAALPQPVWAHN